MVSRGLGFLNKRHCEKTSFVTAGGLIAVVIIIVSMFYGHPVPSVTVEGMEISYLIIAGIIAIAGYLGVIWYRSMHHKKPVFILDFWRA
jgi:hypothetical protein